MKFVLYYRLVAFLILLTLTYSCGIPSFEKKFHLVTDIIDGSTIEVDHSVYIGLIGIGNTSASEDYLRSYILNQRVRFVYDSGKREPVTGHNTKIYGYVATITRISINAEILKRKLANLNEEYLKDSLVVLKQYAGEATGSHLNDSPSIPYAYNNPSIATPSSFVDIINTVKSAVFTIYRQNSDGVVTGLGTGFFVSRDGTGVSNYHVFREGSRFFIKTIDQRQFSVEQIIAENEQSDYIIFKVSLNNENVHYLTLNNMVPQQGEEIFVIGNPSGLENTVTKGIVSAIRSRNSENDLIQIDAAISPGSSGSPVCNMSGNVIGIATFKILIEGCELCNFAINTDLIRNALNRGNY
jgi:serine protease Do